MGNRLKSAKNTTDPDVFIEEKEEELEVKSLVKDERTHKIIGSVLVFICLFLFVAFTSYLFTWNEDQDEIRNTGIQILMPNELEINNLLGSLGAYVAYVFFEFGFGIASFLFCSLFFVLGVNLLFDRKVFSLWRNVRYLLIGLIVLSVSAAYFTSGATFNWGGAFGRFSANWMNAIIGKLGTLAVILTALFSYFIWRVNPVFKWPVWQRNSELPIPDDAVLVNEVLPIKPENIQPRLDLTEGNSLKANQDSLNLLQSQEVVITSLELIEKEEITPVLHPPANPVIIIPSTNNLSPLEVSPSDELTPLEIKPVAEDAIVLDAVSAVLVSPKYDPIADLKNYKYPSLDLLAQHSGEKIVMDQHELEANKNQIMSTLRNYDIEIQKIFATVGPTVTLYEIVPAAGVRISRIKNLEDDIALSLSALGIRIIAPIPGKGTIGIEVPNVKKSIVGMRSLLASEKFQKNDYALPIALGKKIDNENFIVDLAAMPHLLMAGATGQGKSVGLNAILVSLLYKKHPSQLKFVLVDPKKVELSLYRIIEKHFLAKLPGEEDAIITDTRKVVNTLNALCIEMDERYDLLKDAGSRNIREYNEKFVSRRLLPTKGHKFLPFIVLVIDEFADLIMTAGKEIETPIARLAQLARAIGIHLIVATQRPSVNIITGTIKANFPARIAFKVSSKVDSRTILDVGGAEQLIGRGDMLVSYMGEVTRLQCVFVDTPEVEKVVDFIGKQQGYPSALELPEVVDDKDVDDREIDLLSRDPLFNDAALLIVQSQMGSTSLLQRRMKLGYNRAGRLMDQLEAAGIVGPSKGSKVREVFHKTEYELDQYLKSIE
ncbi:MAG: cell division protein FtsK [Chitinophagaceae bacterium]|nr:MAG: cell division protein FtsK [Chitinophagaceae bacterium]